MTRPLTVSLHRGDQVSVQEEVHVGQVGGGSSVHHHLVKNLKHTDSGGGGVNSGKILSMCAADLKSPWVRIAFAASEDTDTEHKPEICSWSVCRLMSHPARRVDQQQAQRPAGGGGATPRAAVA